MQGAVLSGGNPPPAGATLGGMRLSLQAMANNAAWAIIIGLAGLAVVMVLILGPFGLILLGLMTMLVCTGFSLNDQVPTWGPAVFGAQTAQQDSPEQRAGMLEERRTTLLGLRFYRRCGILLVLAGAAGFAWQQWR